MIYEIVEQSNHHSIFRILHENFSHSWEDMLFDAFSTECRQIINCNGYENAVVIYFPTNIPTAS